MLYEDAIFAMKAKLAELCPEDHEVTMNTTLPPPGVKHAHRSEASQRTNLSAIKIPKFNGNIEEWMEFKDLFESLISEDDSIPEIQKLHYLKTSLGEQSLNLIKHLPIIKENYAAAWQILSDRYENTRNTVNKLLTSFMDIPPIANNSAESIRNMLDTLNGTMSALNMCGVETKE